MLHSSGPLLVYQTLDRDWGFLQKHIEDFQCRCLGTFEAHHCCPTLHHLIPVNVFQVCLALLACSTFNLSPLCGHKQNVTQPSIAAQQGRKSAPGSPPHTSECNLMKTKNSSEGQMSILPETR